MVKDVALVMEGGGFRGAYTAGALSWLLKNNIHINYSASISAAAIYAFYYAADMPGMLHDFSIDAISDKKLIGLYPILHEGNIVGYNYMVDTYAMSTYPEAVRRIRESDMDLEIGVFNMTREKLEYYNRDYLDEKGQLLKASCVLPISGKMTEINGEKFLDGGIDTMISVKRALQTGHKKCLVIVTKDKNYVRKPNGFFLTALLKIVYRRFPGMLKILDGRVDAYYSQMDAVYKMEEEGNAILIRPTRDCGVTRFSGSRQQLEDIFQLGYQDMEDKKEEIFKFLEIEK